MSSLSQLYDSHTLIGFSEPHHTTQTKPRSSSESKPEFFTSRKDAEKKFSPYHGELKARYAVRHREMWFNPFFDSTPYNLPLYPKAFEDETHTDSKYDSLLTWGQQTLFHISRYNLLKESYTIRRLDYEIMANKCTTGEPDEPVYKLFENKKKQKTLMYNYSTHRMTHERYNSRKESLRLQTNCELREATFEAVDQHENNIFHPSSTDTIADQHATHGQSSLTTWKRAAGRSKSWKLVPKSTAPKPTLHRQARQNLDALEHQFAKSPLWLPATFLRAQAKKTSPRLGRVVVWRQGSESIPERARRYDPHIHDFGGTPVVGSSRFYTAGTDQEAGAQTSGTTTAKGVGYEPGGAFIRFTWKDNVLIDGIGQLDRFLPIGLVFRNRWRVTGFLRNESFADVYSLNNPLGVRSLATVPLRLEVHVFLDEYHGNCAVYARRLRDRMLHSGNCLDIFWYGDRHVAVMRIQEKPTEFRLHITEKEFPILVNPDKCNDQVALRRRRFRGKPSFAAVVGGRWPGVSSDCQPMLMSEGKSPLAKELERIEKARLKKAQKQRAKRQSQRDTRIAGKLHSVGDGLSHSGIQHTIRV